MERERPVQHAHAQWKPVGVQEVDLGAREPGELDRALDGLVCGRRKVGRYAPPDSAFDTTV
jgi:hypothetical protein